MYLEIIEDGGNTVRRYIDAIKFNRQEKTFSAYRLPSGNWYSIAGEFRDKKTVCVRAIDDRGATIIEAREPKHVGKPEPLFR